MMIQCPVCSGQDRLAALDKRLNIYRCDLCSHAFSLLPEEKQEKYGEEYFLETHKNWFSNPNYKLFDLVYSEIEKSLKTGEFELLDAGCGRGDFLKYVAKRNPEAKLAGVDLIYNQYPGIDFIKGDVLKENIGTRFGAITSLVAIEHINDPNAFIRKLKDILKAGGILIIMTINHDGLLYKIARFLRKIGVCSPYDRLYSSHNLQFFTELSLRRLMEINGLEVVSQKRHNYSIRSVDFQKSGIVAEKLIRLSVLLIFMLSVPFRAETLQTIVCRNRSRAGE